MKNGRLNCLPLFLKGVDSTEEKFVSQYYHEAETSRLERIIKRMWVLIIIMLLALIATNGAWLYYENQFVDEETTITQDVDSGDGETNVTGIGDING